MNFLINISYRDKTYSVVASNKWFSATHWGWGVERKTIGLILFRKLFMCFYISCFLCEGLVGQVGQISRHATKRVYVQIPFLLCIWAEMFNLSAPTLMFILRKDKIDNKLKSSFIVHFGFSSFTVTLDHEWPFLAVLDSCHFHFKITVRRLI